VRSLNFEAQRVTPLLARILRSLSQLKVLEYGQATTLTLPLPDVPLVVLNLNENSVRKEVGLPVSNYQTLFINLTYDYPPKEDSSFS
jgi:hypothetical protein